jgi:hypothetical protein
MIGENIGKIRKEIRDFFLELEKWTKIMNNFGMVIRTDFDRTNFVVYDEIMEIVRILFLKLYFVRKG